MKSHSKALVFFAVSKQIPVVYSADRGRAEKKASVYQSTHISEPGDSKLTLFYELALCMSWLPTYICTMESANTSNKSAASIASYPATDLFLAPRMYWHEV